MILSQLRLAISVAKLIIVQMNPEEQPTTPLPQEGRRPTYHLNPVITWLKEHKDMPRPQLKRELVEAFPDKTQESLEYYLYASAAKARWQGDISDPSPDFSSPEEFFRSREPTPGIVEAGYIFPTLSYFQLMHERERIMGQEPTVITDDVAAFFGFDISPITTPEEPEEVLSLTPLQALHFLSTISVNRNTRSKRMSPEVSHAIQLLQRYYFKAHQKEPDPLEPEGEEPDIEAILEERQAVAARVLAIIEYGHTDRLFVLPEESKELHMSRDIVLKWLSNS